VEGGNMRCNKTSVLLALMTEEGAVNQGVWRTHSEAGALGKIVTGASRWSELSAQTWTSAQ
jgi:hypothetical protein